MNTSWSLFADILHMKYYLFLHANGHMIKYEITQGMYEQLRDIRKIKEGEND